MLGAMQRPPKKSVDIIRDKSLYKFIAFTRAERRRLGLDGLLPHAVVSTAQLVSRVMESLRRLPRDIDKYMALSSLQERNEHVFYRAVIDHLDEIMPLIITPVRMCSRACEYGPWPISCNRIAALAPSSSSGVISIPLFFSSTSALCMRW